MIKLIASQFLMFGEPTGVTMRHHIWLNLEFEYPYDYRGCMC